MQAIGYIIVCTDLAEATQSLSHACGNSVVCAQKARSCGPVRARFLYPGAWLSCDTPGGAADGIQTEGKLSRSSSTRRTRRSTAGTIRSGGASAGAPCSRRAARRPTGSPAASPSFRPATGSACTGMRRRRSITCSPGTGIVTLDGREIFGPARERRVHSRHGRARRPADGRGAVALVLRLSGQLVGSVISVLGGALQNRAHRAEG